MKRSIWICTIAGIGFGAVIVTFIWALTIWYASPEYDASQGTWSGPTLIENDYELEPWTPQRSPLIWELPDYSMWYRGFIDNDGSITVVYEDLDEDGNIRLMLMKLTDYEGWSPSVLLYQGVDDK